MFAFYSVAECKTLATFYLEVRSAYQFFTRTKVRKEIAIDGYKKENQQGKIKQVEGKPRKINSINKRRECNG